MIKRVLAVQNDSCEFHVDAQHLKTANTSLGLDGAKRLSARGASEHQLDLA